MVLRRKGARWVLEKRRRQSRVRQSKVRLDEERQRVGWL
jgi:hypothetical protein